MELCLITDEIARARMAEQAGVERIMVDLETKGKSQRQSGKELFLSTHRIETISELRSQLSTASLVVRINPLDQDTPEEVDRVIACGADYIMLPYFFRIEEVEAFQAIVDKRVKTILLVETDGAAGHLGEILTTSPGDELHIGLNDLSICLRQQVLFDPLCDGTVETLALLARQHRIPFGVGGIGCLGRGDLPVPPLRVLVEQLRLGASRGWLGRTFRDGLPLEQLPAEIQRLRAALDSWQNAPAAEFERNRAALVQDVTRWKQRDPGMGSIRQRS